MVYLSYTASCGRHWGSEAASDSASVKAAASPAPSPCSSFSPTDCSTPRNWANVLVSVIWKPREAGSSGNSGSPEVGVCVVEHWWTASLPVLLDTSLVVDTSLVAGLAVPFSVSPEAAPFDVGSVGSGCWGVGGAGDDPLVTGGFLEVVDGTFNQCSRRPSNLHD